ncbi:MAG: hypothetical protein JWM80_1372 [Cyanobacteria bacterium RYN_339]|nr:hypothetical protein [Cyanobacteria bacterium RYN_339]
MMRRLALGLALVLAIAPAARAEVHDSLPDLISTWVSMQEDPEPEWEIAWLRYEAAESSFLDPTLYAGRTAVSKGVLLDATVAEMRGHFPDRMKQLAVFEQNWGGDLAAVNEGLRREFNTVPQLELYLAFSMSPAKLAIGELAGKPSVCVNARRLLPYRSEPTRVLLARYLFETLLPRWQRTNSVGDRLHLEGMDLWGASRILPGLGLEDLLEVPASQLQAYSAGRARYAAQLLAALDSKDPVIVKRFFGGVQPVGWQPDAGRYLGLLVVRDIAQEIGQEKVPGMPHAEFMTRARRALVRLAGPQVNP